jgi:hypothetical protein
MKYTTFKEVWEKIGGENKTRPEILETLYEEISRREHIASELHKSEDFKALTLVEQERDSFIQVQYGIQNLSYLGEPERLKEIGLEESPIWKAAQAKHAEVEKRETQAKTTIQEPELPPVSERELEYERLTNSIRKARNTTVVVTAAQKNRDYSGFVLNHGNYYALQMIAPNHCIMHRFTETSALPYQLEAHPLEHIKISYGNNRECKVSFLETEQAREHGKGNKETGVSR